MKKATINAKGMRRVRGGHPWVFRSDVLSVDAESGKKRGQAQSGKWSHLRRQDGRQPSTKGCDTQVMGGEDVEGWREGGLRVSFAVP